MAARAARSDRPWCSASSRDATSPSGLSQPLRRCWLPPTAAREPHPGRERKGTRKMESSTISERQGAEVTGCPVMHHDFSKTREMGAYWELANELRESCPHFYNKYSDGGYWVFTRHDAVNDIYKTPEIFSSASITPWEPDPIYRFVPTQVDAPDHIKYRRILNPWFSPKAMEAAAPMMRELCRSFIAPLVAKGGGDFIEDFALLYPTAAFLSVIGVPVSYTEQFAEWVDMFFSGFGGDPAGAENMATALAEMR